MTIAKTRSIHATAADTSAAVDAFMATLQHPFHAEIQSLRAIVLAIDPAILEGIKWNAPSFRTSEYFATTHLRSKVGISVILHRGAKQRALQDDATALDDPAGLLHWLGPDRAMVQFRDGADLDQKTVAFQALLRQWIARL